MTLVCDDDDNYRETVQTSLLSVRPEQDEWFRGPDLPEPLLNAASTPAGSTFLVSGGYTNVPEQRLSGDVFWLDADDFEWFKAPQELSGIAHHFVFAGNWDWRCN